MFRGIVNNCCILSIPDLKKWDLLPVQGSVPVHKVGQVAWPYRDVEICLDTFETSAGKAGTISLDSVSSAGVKCSWKVELTSTPCNYGGVRYWFVCPCWRGGADGNYCGRRVWKLYLPPTSYEFGCRHCQNLSYASRNISRPDRDGMAWYGQMFRLLEKSDKKIERNKQ